MKKIFTLVCAALLSLSVVNAEALLTEHFNQETETLATNDNTTADITGFDWTNITGSGQIYMNDLDLIYSGYKSATDNTRSIEFKATYGKKVAKPFKAKSSGSIFAAAIINVTSCGSTSTGRDYLWALSNVTSGAGTSGNHFGRLCVQKSGEKFQFGIAKQAESAAFISYTEDLEYGQYFVVVEYEFVSGDKNDVVRLYLNPVKGDQPAATIECQQSFINPNSGSDVGSGTKDDPAQLQAFVLSNTSTSNKWACLIDELKVTTKWSDLWEADPAGDPTIIATSDVVFGNVAIGKTVEQKIVVKGTDLKGNINVVSNNAALVPSASVIAKDKAESTNGFELKLTLTPAEGSGSANITLSSEDADSKEISVSWYGLSSVANIAALKELTDGVVVLIESEPIIIQKFEFGEYSTPHFTVQDASGAIHLADYYEVASSWQVGDAISGLLALRFDSEDFVEGFATGMVQGGAVASSDNELVPLDADIANIGAFGPALIKLAAVNFDPEVEEFAKGAIAISKGEISVNIQVKEGCDIIGEKVPASADVIGIVAHPAFNDVIQIRSSEDVLNRTPRIPAAVDQLQSESKAVKVVRNGQVVILRDGKEFNLLGAEL